MHVQITPAEKSTWHKHGILMGSSSAVNNGLTVKRIRITDDTDLVSWATGGLVILQGQAMYSGRSVLTSLDAASLTVLELFIGLSGAETMNL